MTDLGTSLESELLSELSLLQDCMASMAGDSIAGVLALDSKGSQAMDLAFALGKRNLISVNHKVKQNQTYLRVMVINDAINHYDHENTT